MTRDEIDEFFLASDNNSIMEYLRELIYKYENIDIEFFLKNKQFEKITQLFRNIISNTDDELLDYFEQKCLEEKKHNYYLQEMPDERKVEFVKNPKNIQKLDMIFICNLIKSIKDEDKRIEAIQGAKDIEAFYKVTIIKTIEDIDKRIKAMQTTEGLDAFNKATIIKTIEDIDKRIEAMQSTEDLDIYTKIDIIESIEDDDKKIEAMNTTEGLDVFKKIAIIEKIEDEDRRIKAMQTTEGLDAVHKVDIIETIEDEDKRIKAMQTTEGLDTTKKVAIIKTLKDDDKKIEAMQTTRGLNANYRFKATIIETIEDDDKKIKEMQEIEGLPTKFKIAIIKSLKDDDKKIEIMQATENLSITGKTIIIKTIKDDNKKIEVMQGIKGLDPTDKVEIIETIKDDDKKIELIQTIEDLTEIDKLQIITNIKTEKMEEMLLTNNAPKELWKLYRKIENANISFIIDNIELFAESEEQISIDSDYAREILLRMYEKNKNVIGNINFRMLQPKYIETLGEDRINLIACYPRVQERLLELTDAQLYIFDRCIDVYIEQNETDDWTPLANQLLIHIREYEKLISSLEISSVEDIENISITDIENMARIMQEVNWLKIESIEEVREYDQIREKRCQEIIDDENSTIHQIRQAVFQKIFGHDLSYAEMMIKKYGEDIENLDDCQMKDYIMTLKAIIETEDEELLKEIFEQCDFAEIDKVFAERELKTEYLKKYFDTLYIPREEDRVEGTSNVYEAGTDFSMIITSISPFSSYDRSMDDYMEDWNMPVISTQHFCASYIRNDMIGTVPIPYLCYGFVNMRADSLMLSGPTDIFSNTQEFVSVAEESEVYYTPDNQINNTQKFNEMDFRRMQGGVKVQPDYIIVFRKNGQIENMEEAQIASKQWGGMPIVIVDIDKCLENERRKIVGGDGYKGLLSQYKENPSSELAREILQRVRNNRVTSCRFCEDIESELKQLRIHANMNEKKKKVQTDGVKKVDREQLGRVYESVLAKKRRERSRKIKEIYRKVKEIKRGDQDDGR